MNEIEMQTIEIIPVNQYGQCATGCTTEIYGALTPSIAKRLAGGGWHDVKGIDRDGALVVYKVRHSNVYKNVLVDAQKMQIAQENYERDCIEQLAIEKEYLAQILEQEKRDAEEYHRMMESMIG